MALINNYCDAQVFCSRAEGWGLPLIEGSLAGYRRYVSFYSGQTEYLSAVEEYVSPLDFDIEPASNYLDLGNGNPWRIVGGCKSRFCCRAHGGNYENGARVVGKGLVASSIIRRQFSWERSVDKALHSLVRQELK